LGRRLLSIIADIRGLAPFDLFAMLTAKVRFRTILDRGSQELVIAKT